MKLKECVHCHRMFLTSNNRKEVCSEECKKIRDKLNRKKYRSTDEGRKKVNEYNKKYKQKKYDNMNVEEYLNYLEKAKIRNKKYKYSDLTEEQKYKLIEYQKQKSKLIYDNFNSKSFEEKVNITQNKINELLSEPLELLLKSNLAKAKIKKISGRMDREVLQNQKVYILPNINNITK